MEKRIKFFKSFNFALQGIKYCIVKERHMQFHILAAAAVIVLGWYLKISWLKWTILFLTITLVIVLEMVNTAIEKTIDLITPEYHPYAEVAKNVAAGAVLVAALNAIIIGAAIFLI